MEIWLPTPAFRFVGASPLIRLTSLFLFPPLCFLFLIFFFIYSLVLSLMFMFSHFFHLLRFSCVSSLSSLYTNLYIPVFENEQARFAVDFLKFFTLIPSYSVLLPVLRWQFRILQFECRMKFANNNLNKSIIKTIFYTISIITFQKNSYYWITLICFEFRLILRELLKLNNCNNTYHFTPSALVRVPY